MNGPDKNYRKVIDKALEIGCFERDFGPRFTVTTVASLVLKQYYEMPLLAQLLLRLHMTPE